MSEEDAPAVTFPLVKVYDALGRGSHEVGQSLT